MNTRALVLTASLMALNLTLGKIAATLSLPVYLDTIGTIIAATMLPWRYAVATGVGTSLLAGLVIHPAFGVRIGIFKTWWKAGITGFFLAVIAAITAAPVTVMVFGGVTLSGTTSINAILMAAGNNIWQSVLTGSLLIESIDKVAACLLAWFIIDRLPEEMLNRKIIND